MFRTLIISFLSLFLIYSCHSQDENDYFVQLDEKYTALNNNHRKIYSLYKEEAAKYKNTQDLKYLISSKYMEIFLNSDNKVKKMSLIYELLRINNNEYEHITIACNFYLALELEETSPKLSLSFLNESIKLEEQSTREEKPFLPHIYHAKGRWYFNHGNYTLAKIYFDKALNIFNKKDTLYIASMYNNFGLCNERLGKYDLAITQIQYGITLLQKKKNLNKEETIFLNKVYGNLGTLYYDQKKYKKAEENFNKRFIYALKEKEYPAILNSIGNFFKFYKDTNQPEKEKKLVTILVAIRNNFKDTRSKILAVGYLRTYYAKNNDLENLKIYSGELQQLIKKYNTEITEDRDSFSDILNGYIIKNINQEYDFKIKDHQRKNMFLFFFVLAVIVVFINIILVIRKKNTTEKNILVNEKSILEHYKENLEKDIQLQKGKIKNLHLNLNLKIETEKAFLENLKKIKRSKNIDTEEIMKDLFFKTNNLLQIDQKNQEFIGESSDETKKFIQNISEKFPFLTENELRLCVYFRLNLSSKEVSLLENITPGSVRVYKTKIKSKIGLDKKTDLSDFLNSIK